jgi:dTDP-4-amino-4,6-dideoxy-D-galactose acyltransferase
MRNAYDRFHADISFSDDVADAYLEAYAVNAVKGFCEVVLVPDVEGLPAEAFMAAGFMNQDSEALGTRIFRQILSAVMPSCKGWYLKVASESNYYAKERGAAYIVVTTQSTNRAALRCTEKQGFRFGGITHILALST